MKMFNLKTFNLKTFNLKTMLGVMLVGMFFSSNIAADQTNPYLKPDDTWISISGKVKSVSADSFVLDYGEGTVKVEMDDGDRDADGYKLLEGDKVTVNGMIDDDFYELTKIEASSVYVEKLETYFYASAVDEEDYSNYTIWYTKPVIPGSIIMQGTVTKVDDETFILNNGLKSVTVDIEDMPYNPLDKKGYQRIRTGDYVRVSGNMEDELFENKRLAASSIVKLID